MGIFVIGRVGLESCISCMYVESMNGSSSLSRFHGFGSSQVDRATEIRS